MGFCHSRSFEVDISSNNVTNIFLKLGLLNKQVNNYGQHGIITIGGRVLERPPAFSTIDLDCWRAFGRDTESASVRRHLGQVKCQTA
jgi:hypothetical protein